MKEPGIFLVIEGPDGSGKDIQFKLLGERLKAEGYDVVTYDFPQYDHESSYFVREYLNGVYGSAEKLGPYTPSLFYALDRFNAASKIKSDLAAGKVVLANRYVGSNMVYQGSKFSTDEERQAFFQWLDQLEYGLLQSPKPDLNVVLFMPAHTAQAPVGKEEVHKASNTDLTHLEQIALTYRQICKTFPESFSAIECTKEGELMSIPTISQLIRQRIEPLLIRVHKKKSTKTVAEPISTPKKSANPYVQKNDNGSYTITAQGKEYLSEAITNTDKDVYVFTDKLSTSTVAAAMARLSRRGDDMRVTLLDEFTEQNGKDEALLKRVITAYGDDSVQQLSGTHFVVENASNLLTKKLEWGRLAAYLEQSTRYIFFDQKKENGKFKYYTPLTLSDEHAAHYNQQMDELFNKYSRLVQKLTDHVRLHSSEPEERRDSAWRASTKAQACDAARAVLPVATTSTVGVFASGQALESLIMHLQSDELAESRAIGTLLLEEARKVVPTFLERADKPDRGGAWIAQRAQTKSSIEALANKHNLQPMKGESGEAVVLGDFWPKNELDVLPHALYEKSTLSLNELQEDTGAWSYVEKRSALQTYIGERLNRRHKPGRAFEIPHYSFDIICDYGVFRDVQRHRIVDGLEWQQLTPHYGFEIPELVTQANLEDLFEECFDLSFQLYHYLMDAGYALEAQYATLLGHKMRWKLMINAREAYHFIELRTSPQGHPNYRKLAQQMYERIANVHPLIAEGMTFVNKDEDPELTRLAAERATQFKLKQLGG